MQFKNALFFFTLLFLSLRQDIVTCETALGIFEDILEKIRPSLCNISMQHVDFDTGKQEFGRLKGTFDNIEITGLDQFQIIALNTTLLPVGIQNLTLKFSSFHIRGKYDWDGTLIFPIGNEPLHVFGNGGMTIKFGNSSSFSKVIIGYKAGEKFVKELDIDFNITTMKVKMENLMGGGVLEDIFNEYFSEIGPVIYNYYKGNLLGEVKKQLIVVVNQLLKEL